MGAIDKRILIIDIETTGFLTNGGKIVEIGIVSIDLENGKKEVLFDSLCKEKGITLPEIETSWIVRNSDMNPLEVWNAPILEDLKPQIQSILNEYPNGCTAYNNVFDFGFMEDRGFTFPRKLKCPMKVLTPVMKIPAKGRGGYKWPNVQEAWDYFFGKTGYVEKHRGADDAFHEADIVYEAYKRGIFT